MRIASIDIFRALTMVLMIWVNDFWTLKNIPKWLTHAKASEDYMGFSDIIFPLFLFIVGLSIPYAIKNRVLKNEKKELIAKHIIIRAFSLLLIGFFMVNYESIHEESMPISKYTWCLFMAFAVGLIWMNWKKSPVSKRWHIYFQVFGFAILLFLAVIYKGGSLGESWMKSHWWGILGLIGWAYGVNALVYLYSKRSLPIMIVLWFIFNILCVVNSINGITSENEFIRAFSPIYTGTIPAFTTAGIIVILLFQKLSGSVIKWRYISLITLGIVQIIYGLATRPYWGISKIQGTPSWLAICTGIGILLFVLLYYIADVKKQVNWAKIIAPAGTATLTCYMIPYFIYPIRNMIDIRLPDYLNTSIIGLLVSFAFALLVVIFTGWLQQKRFSLKL
ncbi:heparan-alpha-glucosaminide N-acetyltransferase domain-containing protein [Aquimarina muelleri]|uniref:Membrane protein n=1 Tax=Aquimarina muelleri TaxID=279356 RepID=A0A918JWW5_9FLAO|nr:heparan-alpha-glucosaminide N-acetyltransferase domain-containing protein [Aquimarina muelleri]MCX2763319.1 heparan-alpha-glucosaminide N-acetyltransferase domain-containing protein [Aquimarina muelleri]GGX26272.1 membrane protein [Aquimarina muelleri]